jgi:NADPH:quinone reductase-like Zn-dependent oxidoreductase
MVRIPRGFFGDRVFPFAKIVEAHRYMESNEQIGKIVVTV